MTWEEMRRMNMVGPGIEPPPDYRGVPFDGRVPRDGRATRPKVGWLAVGAATWAVVLIAGAAFSARHDPPTTREQRSVAQAAPAVDRAVGELVAAGQGPEVTLEISERRLDAGCRITADRDGVELERSLIIRTVPSAAPAVLDRVAQRLPASYQAGVRRTKDGTALRLRADAGEFIAVTGTVTEPGMVTLTAASGCRPASPRFDPSANPFRSAPDEMSARSALDMIGAEQVVAGPLTMVPCPAGRGMAVTDRAAGQAPLGAEQRDRLRARHPNAVPLADNLDEFHLGLLDGSLTVHADGERLEAVSTRFCQAT